MKSVFKPLTLAALLAVAATSAFAQAAPNPFDAVPKERLSVGVEPSSSRVIAASCSARLVRRSSALLIGRPSPLASVSLLAERETDCGVPWGRFFFGATVQLYNLSIHNLYNSADSQPTPTRSMPQGGSVQSTRDVDPRCAVV